MLEVKDATLRAGGATLFKGLSFSVDNGQMLCVRGGSGAGKTTLLRALLGLWPLDEGFISIDGELLTPSSAEEFRKHIAYVPQEPSLPVETVSEMVRLPFTLKTNRNVPFSRGRLMEEWGRLGLDAGLYDRKVLELSGGQRQRVMLSVCGLMGKRLLLVDDPTSALDHESSALVAAYLRALAEGGCAVVAVTHDDVMAAACDKTVTL